jgi:hypothetical protein
VVGFCERGNKPLGFLKAEENYLLNKGSVVKRLYLVHSSLRPTYFQLACLHIYIYIYIYIYIHNNFVIRFYTAVICLVLRIKL